MTKTQLRISPKIQAIMLASYALMDIGAAARSARKGSAPWFAFFATSAVITATIAMLLVICVINERSESKAAE